MQASTTTSRVCFVAESQVGIGSVARTLKPIALSKTNPTVEWVDVTYHADDGWLERLPLPARVAGTARGLLQTRAGLKRGPYDALLFLTQNPAVLQPRALKRTPTLLWTDVTPVQLDELAVHYNHPQDANPIAGALKKAAVRYAFQGAHCCVGWSEWVRRSLVHDYGVREERTAVVPPGLDLARWLPPDRDRVLPDQKLRLLFVGGDFARKGGQLLLEVFSSQLRDLCELDIVTREDVVAVPGVRVHHGLQAGTEPLLELYRKADVFVLPTLADCQPVASVEAMAMGLPVVTTSLGANAEIIEHERSGWLLQPGDKRALAECLVALPANRERLREFGKHGLKLAHERYDARHTLDRLIALALRPQP